MDFLSILRLCLVSCALLVASPCFSADAAEAGEVVFVAGSVALENAAGRHVPLVGTKVLEGDSLLTGKDGFVYLRTRDGGFFILRPASRGQILAFQYDAARPELSRVKMALETGVARVVTGDASKKARENFRFNTPLAAIGVRGTDFSVYANDTVTRASVRSGGIVVGGFGAGCAPAGSGPCAGDTSLALMAGNAAMTVEFQRGMNKPRLRDDALLIPDHRSPPGPGEPADKIDNSTASNAARVNDTIYVSRLKGDDAAAEPRPRTVNWGRWRDMADLPATVDISTAVREGNTLLAISSAYAIFRQADVPGALPDRGTVGFSLKDHEGSFVDERSGKVTPANALAGALTIDFQARRFNTSLNLAGGDYRANLASAGAVSSEGNFQSDPLAPASVRGGLGGKSANEAAYLYLQRVNPNLTVSGATYWAR